MNDSTRGEPVRKLAIFSADAAPRALALENVGFGVQSMITVDVGFEPLSTFLKERISD